MSLTVQRGASLPEFAQEEAEHIELGDSEYPSDSEIPQDSVRVKVLLEEEPEAKGVGCVRPWEGAVVAPDNAAPNNPAAPDANLELEWIYGFKTQGVRGNLAFDSRGRLIYPAAAVVVAFDAAHNTQEYFRGHTDDVCALAQHPTRPDVIASGQMAWIKDGHSQDPFICVYDWATQQTWQLPALAKQRRVAALAFSADGRYLASAGYDDAYTITVWDWERKVVVGSIGALNKVEVTSMAWSHKNVAELCAVGPKSVGFYYLGPGGVGLTAKQGKFGDAARTGFLAVAYSEKGTACVASEPGDIYAFVEDKLAKVFPKVLDGAISHLARCPGV